MGEQAQRHSVSTPVMLASRTIAAFEQRLAERHRVARLWDADAGDLAAARVLIAGGPFPIGADVIGRLPNLGLIAFLTSGYDSLDIGYARSRGVAVSHSPGASAEDVADHAIALLFAAQRRIVEADRIVREGGWKSGPPFRHRSLAETKVGIVGLGRIGAAIARRCRMLRMDVSWWGPRDKPDSPYPRAANLAELVEASDVVVLSARAQSGQPPLFGRDEIAALGPEGILINIGRGALVDESCLIEALKQGTIAAAGLDVFAQEPTDGALWRDVPNATLTPHIAGATRATIEAMAEMTLRNIDCFFAGRPLENPITDYG